MTNSDIMIDEFKDLIKEARRLRRRCVDAHNLLVRDAAYSAVGEVVRALPADYEFRDGSPGHLIISSFTFWGNREIGSSRRGFEKKLKRLAFPFTLELHERIKNGTFGAWECIKADPAADTSQWRPVGPIKGGLRTVAVIADGKCLFADAVEGQVRAGWIIEDGDTSSLIFSMELGEKPSQRLLEADRKKSWHDKEIPKGDQVQLLDYELDVLTQASCPDWEKCGLQPFYYLPPGQREAFPDEFRRQMVRALVQHLNDSGLPWHVRLAVADDHWLNENLIPNLREIRRKASRRAGRFRGRKVDPTVLPRLISDDECFSLLSFSPDYSTAIDLFPPLPTHPLHLLGLGDEWLESVGLTHHTPLHEAERHLRDGPTDQATHLKRGIERHRQRLRWVNIVNYAVDQSELNARVLNPGYNELRRTLDVLFDPVLTDQPLMDIIDKKGGLARRTETTLLRAELGGPFIRIGDLPDRRYALRSTKGIGSKSLKGITDGLRDAMLSWPLELRRGADAVDPQATEEIGDGLDELDALFD